MRIKRKWQCSNWKKNSVKKVKKDSKKTLIREERYEISHKKVINGIKGEKNIPV